MECSSISFRVYKRRYLNLLLLCLNLIITYFQQTIYTSIANVTAEYYAVSYTEVNLTSLSWDITAILFYYLCGKFIEIYGLQTSLIVSSFVNALSASIKCIALKRNLFWLLLTCQFVCAALNKLFVLSMSILAATWFKSSEFALVVGICEASIAVGISLTFLFPGLVFASEIRNAIAFRFSLMTIIFAILVAIVYVLTLLLIKNKPPTPPCLAEQRRSTIEAQPTFTLFKNKNFILLVICIGLADGIFASINYTLNQSVLSKFSNGSNVVSIAGVIKSLSSIPGSIIAGVLLKKYAKFKLSHICYSIFITLSVTLYMLSLEFKSEILLYLSSLSLGLSVIGTMVLIYDYVVEVTYPYPESVTFGVLFSFMYVPTLLSTPLVTLLIPKFGAVIANTINFVFAFISVLLSIFVSEDLRRKQANTKELLLTQRIAHHVSKRNYV
ncbi:putative MFS-type transporter C09D4.1-like protein [Dinothrombium tinctorium]|uniref:Putative MFS-type transporter C09D4.1-like protein n=1 Tax=Dinothrombium tinctorium TaxID=1965070 RepID=A0A443RH25_9ACAR|nr:putative MFS-type transporter C09D4.1-like protein [Dinothrombium tinctorium]RWS14598.1 putative MFS-type transporter C09D4.1-like protein [Dinothrombium tinctorium]